MDYKYIDYTSHLEISKTKPSIVYILMYIFFWMIYIFMLLFFVCKFYSQQTYEGIAPATKVQFLVQTIGSQGLPEVSASFPFPSKNSVFCFSSFFLFLLKKNKIAAFLSVKITNFQESKFPTFWLQLEIQQEKEYWILLMN